MKYSVRVLCQGTFVYVVCYNPDEAAREQAHRTRLLELVRAELAALDVRQADHPKKACELMASRRFGRYLRMDTRGRLSIDTTKVAAEAKYDGKFVVTTNDDPRNWRLDPDFPDPRAVRMSARDRAVWRAAWLRYARCAT